jgi:hypothetical protein
MIKTGSAWLATQECTALTASNTRIWQCRFANRPLFNPALLIYYLGIFSSKMQPRFDDISWYTIARGQAINNQSQHRISEGASKGIPFLYCVGPNLKDYLRRALPGQTGIE